MKSTKMIAATGALTMVLMAATPAFADSGNTHGEGNGLHLGGIARLLNGINLSNTAQFENADTNNNDGNNKDENGRVQTNASSTVHVSGTVTAINGTTVTLAGKNGAVYTVNAAGAKFAGQGTTTVSLASIQVGHELKVRGTLSGSIISATEVTDASLKVHAKRNVLQNIGSIAVGVVTSVAGQTFVIDPAGAKTTATVTTNPSTTYMRNGQATTSAAVTVGSHVLIFGTTSAATSSNPLVSASLVYIIDASIGFLKHFFLFR